jgi:DNA topoisomerase VI subunit B
MADSFNRETFRTSRELDYFTEKELTAQTGHGPDDWPLVVLKELLDNSLDAAEDARVAPKISVVADTDGIEVRDNGPGIPTETVTGILDFTVRVSSREAYVSPCRGAQGNALKTLVAMPFVLDGGQSGRMVIDSHHARHVIELSVDRIRQKPVAERREEERRVKSGTSVRICWPRSASKILQDARARFLQIVSDFTFLNPHLTLTVDWFGDKTVTKATNPAWAKWLASDPTCPHWYEQEHFERLVAACVARDADHGTDRTVADFISTFRGLTGNTKRAIVLDATGLKRVKLSELARHGSLDTKVLTCLLAAMKGQTNPVKPKDLGILGREHLAIRLREIGADMDTFNYHAVKTEAGGLPLVVETAFAWCEGLKSRRLVSGVNWSPGIRNPFRQLGKSWWSSSLDSVLEQQKAGKDEPVMLVIHAACPRVTYTDRGKSAVLLPA